MKRQKSKRGGVRAGAGRKPSGILKTRFHISLSTNEINQFYNGDVKNALSDLYSLWDKQILKLKSSVI